LGLVIVAAVILGRRGIRAGEEEVGERAHGETA
jgi:hypothetical protein